MESQEILLQLLIGPLMLLISIIFIMFPPKKINFLYGHRTKMSMLNQDTWKEANSRSMKMMFLISVLTCLIQLFAMIIGFETEKTILYATIFLVAGLIIGLLLIEKELKKIFDIQGNRK
jgi:uncharacterized membrane protein